jgi:hypothetical protein
MTIDLNRLPYFDDYDEDKNYHRVLFKPGLAVQARELTQLQTILQNQVERFGDHIFQNGSRVLGGTFDPQDPVDYVRVQININDIPDMVGGELVGAVTGLKARVIHAEADPSEVGVSVLFINYTDLNNSESVVAFTSENISYTTATATGSFSTTFVNITGKGSIFGITEGVLYVNGFFVKFDTQKIAIDTFNSKANKRVYMSAEFVTVNSDEDSTLLDNAQGYNNFNAPGADRLRCNLTLNVSNLDVDLADDSNFVLLELREGQIYIKSEKTIYNEIADDLAKRTFNESGDYVVRGWDIRTREHLNTGSNGGRFSETEGGDSDKLVIELEKGLAYVKGYEVETVSTRPIETDKSSSSVFIDNQYSFIPSGAHVLANEIMGMPEPDSYNTVQLYDTAENRITYSSAFDDAAAGTQIGTARLISFVEESGQYGQPSATVRFYLGDIKMNAGQIFASVRAIKTSNFFADVKLENGAAILYDSANLSRLIYVGNDYTKSVKNDLGDPDTTLTFMKQGTGTISTAGLLSGVVSLGVNETLIYGTGTLASLAKETIILHVTGGVTITGTGTVSVTTGSPIVTGVGTNFNNLNLGDRFVIATNSYIIQSIESNLSMTLISNAISTASGAAWTKSYVSGDLIDLNSKGYGTGAIRVVTATPTSISIDLGETFSIATASKLSYRAIKDLTSERSKTIRSSRYVKIDGSSYGSLEKFFLGVPDAIKIRQVRKHTSDITLITDGEDVTSRFVLGKNESEFSYGTSFTVTDTPITTSDHLLIIFDYYEPDLAGSGSYFSIDSYPIDDAIESNTTVKTEDLDTIQRNYIDFRTVTAPTVVTGTSIGTAPSNPVESVAFTIPAGGYKTPVPGTNLKFDYSYYLARRDILAVKPNGDFKVFKGQSSIYPMFPTVPETYMSIANIFIPPFPSLSENYAKILGRKEEGVVSDKITFSRHTMSDIGAIKQRVKNLEYYNALSLLEKNTLDLLVLDENGLDRFKNGVFINPFVDHTLSDITNSDYNIAVNRKDKSIQPPIVVEGFDTRFNPNAGGAFTAAKTGALVHIPYVEKVLKEQLFATTTRNVELSSYRFIGGMSVYPDIDTWADTTTVDKTFDFGNDVPESRVVSTEIGAWQKIGTGAISGTSSNVYKVYHREGGVKHFNGNEKLLRTFSTIQEVTEFVAARGRFRGDAVASVKAKIDSGSTFEDISFRNQIDDYSSTRMFIVYGGKVTTEETIQEQRTNIETTISTETESYDLGNFVTDISLIPYIRAQTLKLYSYGLKPNTRYHVFFDGENMNDFAAPVVVSQYFDASQDKTTGYLDYDTDLSNIGTEGSSVFSNSNGEVLIFMRLPNGTNKRFRVGEKEIIITDSPTNDTDASSYSKGSFIASGLNLQKQNTIISTKTQSVERREVIDSRTRSIQRSTKSPAGWFEVGPSCAAYSIFVDEDEDVEGVFLSSIDIWLSAIHPSLGVWFELREMNSAGGITRTTIPYSVVWMNRNDTRLNISNDGIANATNVNFDSPVFLYNNTQYAFVIHTEGLNPDTYFWVSRLGGTDVASGNPVTNRGQFGTFYTTNNNLNWDIVPDIDLKIRFNRMSTGATATAPITSVANFYIEDVEFITDNDAFPTVFFREGEPVRGAEILNIAIDGAGILQVGDTIVDGTSNTSSTIINIDGTDIFMGGFDFIANSTVTIYEGLTATVRDTGVISSVDFGTGIVDSIDTTNFKFDITHSNGKFFVGSSIRSILPDRHKTILNGTELSVTYAGAGSSVPNPYAPTGTITLPVGLALANTTLVPAHTIDQFGVHEYSSATIRPSYLKFDGLTDIQFEIVATEGTTIGSKISIYPNEDYEFSTVKNVLSRSEEVRLLSGAKSLSIDASITSESEYLSPVLDEAILGVVLTGNQLNNDTTGELLPKGGNLNSKYISKIIELSDDNIAEDLLVQLQEYRPEGTAIQVWARIKNNADITELNDRPWFEMYSSKNAVSSSVNRDNFIDTTYTVPVEFLTGEGDTGVIQYTTSGNPAVIEGSGMTASTNYIIVTTGSTDFTDFGAGSNVVGDTFTATGPSDGNGTVSPAIEEIYSRYSEFQLKIGMSSTNTAIYPRASSLRAIALQK